MELSLSFATLTPALGHRLRATKLQSKCLTQSFTLSMRRPQLLKMKINVASNDPTTVDYTSMTSSVFPAEACETVGGEACEVDAIYPEVKLTPQTQTQTEKVRKTDSETVDREYLQYDGPKTVFPGEACDDLGGEFCDPDYQSGVY